MSSLIGYIKRLFGIDIFGHEKEHLKKAADELRHAIDETMKENLDLIEEVKVSLISYSNTMFLHEVISATSKLTGNMIIGFNLEGTVVLSTNGIENRLGFHDTWNNVKLSDVFACASDENKRFLEDVMDVTKLRQSRLIERKVGKVEYVYRVRCDAVYHGDEHLGYCVIVDDVTSRLRNIGLIREITQSPRIKKYLDQLEDLVLTVKGGEINA